MEECCERITCTLTKLETLILQKVLRLEGCRQLARRAVRRNRRIRFISS